MAYIAQPSFLIAPACSGHQVLFRASVYPQPIKRANGTGWAFLQTGARDGATGNQWMVTTG
jgi:hypothetical protein